MWGICNPLYPSRLTPNPSSRKAAASKMLMIKIFMLISDVVRTLDVQAIPTTIFRLGYPRQA